MRNYKIIINEPKVSSEEIATRKNFDVLLKKYNLSSKPFFKTTWFISISTITLVTISCLVGYTIDYGNNIGSASLDKVVENKNRILMSINNPTEVPRVKKNEMINKPVLEKIKMNVLPLKPRGNANTTTKQNFKAFHASTSSGLKPSTFEDKHSSKKKIIDSLTVNNENKAIASTDNNQASQNSMHGMVAAGIENASSTSDINNETLTKNGIETLSTSLNSNTISIGQIVSNKNKKINELETTGNPGLEIQDSTTIETPLQSQARLNNSSPSDSLQFMDNNKPISLKWTIGVWISWGLVDEKFEKFKYDMPSGPFAHTSHSVTTHYLSNSNGLKISKKISKKLVIKTGIAYSFSRQKILHDFSFPDSAYGYIGGISATYTYKAKYWSIPLSLGYYFTNNRLRFNSYLGLSLRTFTGQSQSDLYIDYKPSYANLTDINKNSKSYVDMILNIEVDYLLYRNISLSYENTFTKGSILKSPFISKYSSFSLAVGINYNF